MLASRPLNDPDLVLRRTVAWGGQTSHREMGLREATSVGWGGSVFIYESRRHLHSYVVEEGFPGRGLPVDPVVFEVTAFAPGRIELNGRTPRAGTLFVSEPFYPGWRATVDGVNATVVRLQDGFMGVALGSEARSVVLRYEPASFMLGFWITGFTITVVLVASGLGGRRDAVSGRPPSS